jgi:hypothetical protein
MKLWIKDALLAKFPAASGKETAWRKGHQMTIATVTEMYMLAQTL